MNTDKGKFVKQATSKNAE